MRKALFLTLLFLSACAGGGGGSGDSENTTKSSQPAAPVIQKKSVVIYAEGDSTMFGAQYGKSQAQHNQPAEMQIDLRTWLGNTVSVENHAVPGTTITDSIAGTGGYTQPLTIRLASSQAQIVMSNFAINDSQKVTTTEYAANLLLWVAAVRAAGKTPVLVEPNPTNLTLAPWTSNLASYVEVMRYVALTTKTQLVEQFYVIQQTPNWTTVLSADGIHPLDSLYGFMGDRSAEILKPMVSGIMEQ